MKVSDSDERTKQAMLLQEKDGRSRREWSPIDSGGVSEYKAEASFQLCVSVWQKLCCKSQSMAFQCNFVLLLFFRENRACTFALEKYT